MAITKVNVLLLLNNSGHCERTWPLWVSTNRIKPLPYFEVSGEGKVYCREHGHEYYAYRQKVALMEMDLRKPKLRQENGFE